MVIYGAWTDYTKELNVEIERMGLSQNVIFLGLVKDTHLEKLYRNAVTYIYTAPQEDFGMGVIEAMGAGVPVIAWDNGGPGRIVINESTGCLIKKDDVESFTEELIRVTRDSNLIMKMGKNAILRVKNNFSWTNHFLTIEQSLRSLIN